MRKEKLLKPRKVRKDYVLLLFRNCFSIICAIVGPQYASMRIKRSQKTLCSNVLVVIWWKMDGGNVKLVSFFKEQRNNFQVTQKIIRAITFISYCNLEYSSYHRISR